MKTTAEKLKLTEKQIEGLIYHAAFGNMPAADWRAMRIRCPDPRVIEALADKGMIVRVGWNYGPIFRATELGEQIACAAVFAWAMGR